MKPIASRYADIAKYTLFLDGVTRDGLEEIMARALAAERRRIRKAIRCEFPHGDNYLIAVRDVFDLMAPPRGKR